MHLSLSLSSCHYAFLQGSLLKFPLHTQPRLSGFRHHFAVGTLPFTCSSGIISAILGKKCFRALQIVLLFQKKKNHWVVRWSTPSPLCVHKGAPSASRSTSVKRARRSLTLTVKR